ncbi:uncharacterized protein LOC119692566 [Plutella xylostella]|uniref:uncharacterized protein LOC119692566 n=1 Tax=Plutella xylostella TaxID=51655 RepID=UPI0020323674|nr:uncharacterized protein LOC119692566 [Plutella xylostella]
MGASANVVAAVLLLSVVMAVPTGGPQRHKFEENAGDLSAESSEIVSESVAPPPSLRHQEPLAAASSVPGQATELEGDAQNFFPSFANLFEPRQHSNNYRLGFGNQEAAYSQRPNSYRSLLNYPNLFGNYRSLDSFGKQNTPAPAAPVAEASPSILGSGNFGVITGGTFFAQNDDEESDFSDTYSSYYNNGHGRPALGLGYIANPRPNYSQDQFANFRDFADINTPSNAAYSHFVVVYANKNATLDEVSEESRRVVSEPKNIFETLELLDKTEPIEATKAPPKLSKSKAKLAALKQKSLAKKEQWKKASVKPVSLKHDAEEPLLALS